jgi:TonB family protein
VSGSAVLRCSPDADGKLSGCANGGEKPEGEGFYEAALSPAPLFTLAAPPVGAEVELPFEFTRRGEKDPRVLTSPRWTHAVSIEEQRALFPAAAQLSTKQGAAILRCRVTAEGGLEPCTVMGEAPARQGFGDAALQMARRMAMNPWSDAGYPYEGMSLTYRVSFARQ